MSDFNQKLDQIKWLKAAGIAYYCSDKKDSINSVISDMRNKITKIPKEADVAQTQVSLKINKTQEAPALPVKKHDKTDAVSSARIIADSAIDLEDLRAKLLNFDGCGLKKFANKTVFSDGNPEAKILFIGEAPGANEDLQGIPFCGESGKLLDAMLASIDIYREKNAYITNTVFWRPPGNRPPTPEEIDICRPFVEKHIALINPSLIVLVGSTAATGLLGNHEGISRIRQNNFSYTNRYLKAPIHTTAIYHPAYLLRQPFQKKAAWFDLIKIQQYITQNVN